LYTFYCSILLSAVSTLHPLTYAAKQANWNIDDPNHYLHLATQQIRFTQPGLRIFFRTIFNNIHYTIEYLPHSLGHLLEFLSYSKRTNQPIEYDEFALRLFYNRLKACRYISIQAVDSFCKKAPELLKRHWNTTLPLASDLQSHYVDTLYRQFDPATGNFLLFKNDPQQFFKKLADSLIALVDTSKLQTQLLDQERCKQALLLFLDTALSRVMFDIQDATTIWPSIKALSETLIEWHSAHIINEDELDDLYHTLLERFYDIVDLTNMEIPEKMAADIRADLENDQVLLFALEEQEELLQTKAERMADMLLYFQARSEGYKKGLIIQ
jgi:hypothetical protein